MFEPIPIVDLFAGPGGLGEGFSSANGDPFRIAVSAEMDPAAHQTLRLRAFYRLCKRKGRQYLDAYYRYCNGEQGALTPYDSSTEDLWKESFEEVMGGPATLGTEEGNRRLDAAIEAKGIAAEKFWVLIGGPPCQAYSLVGRARNQGKKDYRPEDDHRHFLYREYLRVISQYRPSIFVMENVKGILSSSVGEQQIFHTILRDLADPDAATGLVGRGHGYRIYSLARDLVYDKSMDPARIDVRDFIIRAEQYGIPQARHRVILVGVREDWKNIHPKPLDRVETPASVREAIGNLPKVRSKLSKSPDSTAVWSDALEKHFLYLHEHSSERQELNKLAVKFASHAKSVPKQITTGAVQFAGGPPDRRMTVPADIWYRPDDRLKVWLNHEARGHISEDLRRYAYAATFAQVFGRSPKGAGEFSLTGLRPNHENWESGKFADRFRVQLADAPATTITSHISKDGHYFIHYDPKQCRSLTVREAARLQTFPDDYFFQGARTQQYHQVGNAVPPLLAKKIANAIYHAVAIRSGQKAA